MNLMTGSLVNFQDIEALSDQYFYVSNDTSLTVYNIDGAAVFVTGRCTFVFLVEQALFCSNAGLNWYQTTVFNISTDESLWSTNQAYAVEPTYSATSAYTRWPSTGGSIVQFFDLVNGQITKYQLGLASSYYNAPVQWSTISDNEFIITNVTFSSNYQQYFVESIGLYQL